jgi:plasmid replication initiation protein
MYEIKNKKAVVVSNSLVAGKYHLTKEEQNLVYLLIAQIDKTDEDFKDYKILLGDLDKATGVEHNRKRVKELQLSIMQKPIILPNKAVVHWFSYIEPLEKESALKVRFDKSLKPYLLQLKSEFTKAELGTLFTFKSKYSSRLYMLLKSDFDRQSKYRSNLYVIYDVGDIHNRFKMPKSYTKYSNFKDKFLSQSIEEINEKTELEISYSELKTGRKITSINFCISHKEKTESQLRKEIEETETLSDYLPYGLNNKAVEVLLNEDIGFKKHDLKHFFEHYKIEDIEQICYELFNCWDSDKLMSRQGFFRGKLKLLNRRKTQNFDFGFDKLFDEKNKLK